MAARRRDRPERRNDPAGYYFTVGPNLDNDGWDCTVYMTDAAYFDTTGSQSDWHITPELTRGGMRLPPGLSEEAEGVFTYEGQPQAAIDDLTRRGFRTSEDFTRLVVETDQPARANVQERRERARRDVDEWEYQNRSQPPPPPPIPPGTRPRRTPRAPAHLASGLSLEDLFNNENAAPAPLPRRRGRTQPEEAVAKKPPGKTIWERLDDEDD